MMALSDLAPGVAICVAIVGVSILLEQVTGLPSLGVAICLGIAFSVLSTPKAIEKGVQFSSDTILKLGIVCLGAGLSFSDVQSLGLAPIIVAFIAVCLCILTALCVGYALRRSPSYGLVTGGGVGICGTAAVAALGACVPRGARNVTDAEIAICVVVITLLSAVGVVAYPQIAAVFQLNETETGIFLGGTIHGVGQAIAAGHAQSQDAGDAATLTKLLRVSLLIPIVMVASVMQRKTSTSIVTRLPLFLAGFLLLMIASNANLIPEAGKLLAALVAKISLLIAMSGLGLKTRIAELKQASLELPLLLTAYSVALLIAILAILLLNRTIT